MKKFLKYFLLTILSVVVVFVLVLSIKYSPLYVYRLARFNVADVYDYKHFENRVISASEDAFDFAYEPAEAYVEGLFQDAVTSSGFQTFEEWAEASQTTALIFIRRDTILYEKYFNGFHRDSYFHSQSMAKSFISTLIGFAVQDGLIGSINDPVTDYIPELAQRDQRFQYITIRNLLMMQSGLEYNTSFIPGTYIHAPWHDEAVGYYHGNVRKLLLKRVGIAGEPGVDFQYCNYNTSYLGLIIERATGKSVSDYLEEKLWSRIMEYDALFSVDSRHSGFEYMPSRLIARAIDYARFGRLFMHNGNWNGRQLIPAAWVSDAVEEDTTVARNIYPDFFGNGCARTYYKYQWWGHTNCDGTYQFFASGNLGQEIYVIPHREIIIVHCGKSLEYYHSGMLWQVAGLTGNVSDFN